VLTSFAFFVGQFWIIVQNLWRKVRGRPPAVALLTLDELPAGQTATFRYPTKDDPALVVRPDADTLIAYASQCTHLQCPVLPELKEGRLHCPCHAGYFDLSTGEPIAGPPRRSLPRIHLEIRGKVVYATGIDEAAT
jgi:Rieske Fe-S protein